MLASVLASTQPTSVPSAICAAPLLGPMPSTMFVVWVLAMVHQLQELAADGAGVGAGANLFMMTPTRRGRTSDSTPTMITRRPDGGERERSCINGGERKLH